jgi:hypothetical protein
MSRLEAKTKPIVESILDETLSTIDTAAQDTLGETPQRRRRCARLFRDDGLRVAGVSGSDRETAADDFRAYSCDLRSQRGPLGRDPGACVARIAVSKDMAWEAGAEWRCRPACAYREAGKDIGGAVERNSRSRDTHGRPTLA